MRVRFRSPISLKLIPLVAGNDTIFDGRLERAGNKALVYGTCEITFQLVPGIELNCHGVRKCPIALADVFSETEAAHRGEQCRQFG